MPDNLIPLLFSLSCVVTATVFIYLEVRKQVPLENTDWSAIDDLDRLKRIARILYSRAQLSDHMDCGRQMQEQFNPSIAIAREAFSACWSRIQDIDPTTPKDPFI